MRYASIFGIGLLVGAAIMGIVHVKMPRVPEKLSIYHSFVQAVDADTGQRVGVSVRNEGEVTSVNTALPTCVWLGESGQCQIIAVAESAPNMQLVSVGYKPEFIQFKEIRGAPTWTGEIVPVVIKMSKAQQKNALDKK